jgi:TonB-dependent starch-binding outer membrane protein SusC
MRNEIQNVLLMSCKFIFYGGFLQVLFVSLLFAGPGNAQEQLSVRQVYVNLNLEDARITDLFRVIESQSKFKFFYDRKIINRDLKFDFHYNEVSIHQILLELSRQANLKFKQVNNTINVKENLDRNLNPENAIEIIIQTRNVTGRVTAQEDGQTLPGVNVIEKGTNHGTVTDIQGYYSLEVSEGATLVFSSVGYMSQEVEVGNRSVIDLAMRTDIQQLEELVVIGYGTVRKSDLTGSVASITEAELKRTPMVSLDQGLQGRAAGVHVTSSDGSPGGGVSVRIRGGNSILSGNEPLYVIDGFPIYSDNQRSEPINFDRRSGVAPNALASINPNDIESIEILKDASATAIYGSRGANGVVLITTKRGRVGRPNIEFNSFYGVQELARKIEMMNGQQYAEYFNERRAASNVAPYYDGSSAIRGTPESFGVGMDWQDQAYQVAPMQNHQFTVSGGSDQTRYAISANYFDQKGIIRSSRFQRGSFRVNLDQRLSNRFNIGNNLTVNHSVNNVASTGGQRNALAGIVLNALATPPTYPIFDEQGNYFTDFTVTSHLQTPNALINEVSDPIGTSRILGNLFADYTFIDGLTLRVSLGGNISDIQRDTWMSNQTIWGARSNGLAIKSQRNIKSWLNENTLSYVRTFNNVHSINAVVGHTLQQEIATFAKAESTDFITGSFKTNNLGAGQGPRIPESGKNQWSMASWLGRINYVLMDKYLFTVTGRADGSSKFGAGNKWAFFPSAAVAWRVSQEDFMQNSELITDLRIRGSYGITGNAEIGLYQSLSALAVQNYTFGGNLVSGFGPDRIANPDLRWETTSQVDIGIDMGLFNDRITFVADYYRKITNDLLVEVTIPRTSGFNTALQNSGKIRNYGFELGLGANILVDDFKWRINGNWSMNRNEVLDLGASEPFRLSNNLVSPGHPMGAWIMWTYDGVFANQEEVDAGPDRAARPGDWKYKDINEDGVINDLDRVVVGSPHPDFIYGLTNTFSFLGFDLDIFLQGVKGGQIFWDNGQGIENPSSAYNQTVRVLNRWTPENTITDIPRAGVGNTRVSTFYLHDGSFLRAKNISLGYNVPVDNIVWLQNGRIYFSVQNAFTITDYPGYDPEVNRNGQTNIQLGTDLGIYPKARIYTLGVNLTL